jgi:hypothetical protein
VLDFIKLWELFELPKLDFMLLPRSTITGSELYAFSMRISPEVLKGLVATLAENGIPEGIGKLCAELFSPPGPPSYCNWLTPLFSVHAKSFFTHGSFCGETFPDFSSAEGQAALISKQPEFNILFPLLFCSLQTSEGDNDTVDTCDMEDLLGPSVALLSVFRSWSFSCLTRELKLNPR